MTVATNNTYMLWNQKLVYDALSSLGILNLVIKGRNWIGSSVSILNGPTREIVVLSPYNYADFRDLISPMMTFFYQGIK